MSYQDVSLHRVRGLANGVNWRLTKFAAAVPHHLTCGLCHVISCPTFLLPCLHTLCESCVIHSVRDGNAVCPFDEEPFSVGDCQKFQWPPATADKLKACCWNASHGCTFVGPLQAVLTHYEQECTFHAVACPRCSCSVLHQDLPRHYMEGCQSQAFPSAAGHSSLRQGAVFSAEDIGRCADELKALIIDPYQDRLPALQSQLNEILEEERKVDIQVEAVSRAIKESEHRLTRALKDFSTVLGGKLQSQESLLRSSLKKNYRISETSEPVTNHGLRVDAVVGTGSDSERRLSHQLAEATQQLSTIFAQKLQSQQSELVARLERISELGTSNSGDAAATSPNEMPWRLEERHILRKLELMASESHAHLELLRTSADQELRRPLVEYTRLLPDILAGTVVVPPLTGKLESDEEGYIVSVTNIDDVVKSEKFISLFTDWYRRDRYLKVAAYGFKTSSARGLTVCLKWGTTLQGSCSAFPEARVCVKHPNHPEKEDLPLKKLPRAGRRAALFGFQENFGLSLLDLEASGSINNGTLTLVVSFKIQQ
ncbi:uncharacterized protein LOC144146021 [Haemaphysalis longicornis]